MNLGNLNVASRLLLGFAIPLAFFIAFGIWLLTAMTHISSNALQIKTETVPFALKAKTMEKDVIQVQQWLTDISATRAQDGLNDGFTQAEASRNSFLASLDEYEKMFSAKGDQTSLNKVQTIRSDFENYYKVGLKMAHGYIDGGPSEGNKLMAQFDKTSQSLQDVLGPFIQSQVSEMELNIDAVENDATTAKRTALILLVLVVGVSVLLARFISLSITRPLNIMQSVVSEVELNSDFTKRIELNQTDEVGKTAAAFNRLLDTMRNIIQQNRTAINQISDSAQGLSNSVEKVTQSAGLQSEAATTVAASTEEISVTISEISSSAAGSGSVATQEQRHTEHALKLTEDSMQGINSTAQSIKDSASSVSRLSESSTQINNIVVVIKEIADQTNLLALNAAIEAARAGEQGRGFAVVADEVRKLAERTSNSTGEIESLIGSIQKEIEIAVQKMSGADAQATRSVDSAQAVKTALEEIGGEGNLLELRMKDVTSSIVECDSAIREIARQMEKIAQMTEEGSVAATYTRDTAQVLNNLAHNLRLSIERFKV